MVHSFDEKETELYKGKSLPVWQTPKYKQSKAKAIEMIECGQYGLEDGDFWILMNGAEKSMVYTGLITSHNACLKINDKAAEKFNPACVTVDKNGYDGSLVYTYISPEQGIYEVGEASSKNCKNAYPYAMAFKRLFDRVVLKLSRLAYDGVYSESEADEFKRDYSALGGDNTEAINNPTSSAKAENTQRKAIKITVADKVPQQPTKSIMPAWRINALKEIATKLGTDGVGVKSLVAELQQNAIIVSAKLADMTDTEFAATIEALERVYGKENA